MRRHLVHNSRPVVGVTPNAVHSVNDDEHQGGGHKVEGDAVVDEEREEEEGGSYDVDPVEELRVRGRGCRVEWYLEKMLSEEREEEEGSSYNVDPVERCE